MINNIRVVVDTNVLISGLFGIKSSPSSQILNAVRTQKIILVTSPVILEEIGEVINRDRIVKLTKGKQLSQIVGRDTKDDKFL